MCDFHTQNLCVNIEEGAKKVGKSNAVYKRRARLFINYVIFYQGKKVVIYFRMCIIFVANSDFNMLTKNDDVVNEQPKIVYSIADIYNYISLPV